MLRIEEDGIAAPGFLGVIQRIVRTVEKLLKRQSKARKYGDAHGSSDMHSPLGKMIGLPQPFRDHVRICNELCIVRYDGGNDRKFVSAKSKCPAGRQSICETFADADEQPVAHGMAVKVVNRLEPIEIDNAQRQPRSRHPCFLDLGFQMGEKGAAVRQFRQAVNIGKQQVLIVQRFRALLRNNHALEIAVVGQQDGHHARTDQQNIDGNGDECRLL
ncbi:hypothetical protein D3C87_1150600 [compost metagenome]